MCFKTRWGSILKSSNLKVVHTYINAKKSNKKSSNFPQNGKKCRITFVFLTKEEKVKLHSYGYMVKKNKIIHAFY